MSLKLYKIHVQVGEYVKGLWKSNSSNTFNVTIEARHAQEAEKIAQAQFGGPEKCKVSNRGEVR